MRLTVSAGEPTTPLVNATDANPSLLEASSIISTILSSVRSLVACGPSLGELQNLQS